MNDGRKNVPFAIDQEDDSDVFSSVEVQRADESTFSGGGEVFGGAATPTLRSSGALQAPRVATTPRVYVRLTVETSGEATDQVDVTYPTFTIGRHGCDLDLKDQYVSSAHAMITVKRDVVRLRDLGSHNGVFLRIADDMSLEDWDEIACGSQRFLFRTTWDAPSGAAGSPNAHTTPSMGGNLPADAVRLIQLYSGDQIGNVWRLGSHTTIGRRNADICEPDDDYLSDTHAVLQRRDGKVYIRDGNSQHGTFIRVLESVELIDGDVFQIGRTRLKIGVP